MRRAISPAISLHLHISPLHLPYLPYICALRRAISSAIESAMNLGLGLGLALVLGLVLGLGLRV